MVQSINVLKDGREGSHGLELTGEQTIISVELFTGFH